MPRRARFIVSDGTYHVMVRGNNRADIFHDDKDFGFYLEQMIDNKEKYNLKIFHYALLNNHLHMIIQSPEGKNLSEAMKRLNVTYTRYYRRKYGGIGHLFQGRFKSFLIQKGRYLLECGIYVELNPVRAGMVEKPEDYKWNSYRVYVTGEKSDVVNLDPEYLGLHEDESERIRIYREYMAVRGQERRNEERFFKSGVYGSEAFMKEMEKKGLKAIWSHGGRPKGGKN
ncbi:MAG: transposase [Elusimicrobiota bacterium]|nr:transposase [Elusimicrobiota bacterium]